jgi:hypothetical protein
MDETNLKPAADESLVLLEHYLRERVQPHPILSRHLPDAAVWVAGSVAAGLWDENSEFDVRLLLPDEEHTRLAAALREAHLWDPARDYRLRLKDREPFRRFPGARVHVLSTAQLGAEFAFELPVALWAHLHARVLQDPLGALEAQVRDGRERFRSELPGLQCEHYYLFREARNDMIPRIMPRRLSTVLAIKRGEAVREALRLCFLAEGKPYPYDKWLEVVAERETECGSSVVTAVRALISAREAQSVERASKVLRDRVAFALQQGGVREPWLEQWWLWPGISSDQ